MELVSSQDITLHTASIQVMFNICKKLTVLVIDSWIHCNDTRVSIATEESVESAEAYLLFYVRQTGKGKLELN
jgi:hypothetical protein